MDWNDFRFILAISRTGSLKGAARELGNDHSTIFRWLDALEARVQVQLFERNGGTYTPTDAGDRMLLAAERMEVEALAAKWLTETVLNDRIVYRSSSLINQMMAVKAGIGMALLPCYLGDQEADIESVSVPEATLTRELWLITHRDLRNTARVRAFFDVVGQGLTARRQLLEGSSRNRASL